MCIRILHGLMWRSLCNYCLLRLLCSVCITILMTSFQSVHVGHAVQPSPQRAHPLRSTLVMTRFGLLTVCRECDVRKDVDIFYSHHGEVFPQPCYVRLVHHKLTRNLYNQAIEVVVRPRPELPKHVRERQGV